jgi:hypothetical protein
VERAKKNKQDRQNDHQREYDNEGISKTDDNPMRSSRFFADERKSEQRDPSRKRHCGPGKMIGVVAEFKVNSARSTDNRHRW